MVILDSTTLLLLLHPSAGVPQDPETKLPVERCKERVEYLLEGLSQASIRVMIPTPVLSEILVVSGPQKAKILKKLSDSSRFRIQPFDTMAAIEVAMLTEGDLKPGASRDVTETKAKLKFDRQIIAIALVSSIQTIYSDDLGLGRKAASVGIMVVTTAELPLPPEPPQAELALPEHPAMIEHL